MFPCLVQRGGGLNGLSLVAAAFVMLMGTATQAGTVSILSAEQTVFASIQGGDDERFDDRTSTEPAPFDDAAAVESVGDGFSYQASSRLISMFGPDGLSFDFERRYETRDTREIGLIQASVGFDVEVVFSVDATCRAAFRTSREDEASSTPGAGADGDASFALVGVDGTDFLAFPGEEGLLLEPGTYAVQLTASRTSNGGRSEIESLFAPIRFDLSFAEADDDTPPNPIPLPPAASSAAALLGAGALTRFRRRRRLPLSPSL